MNDKIFVPQDMEKVGSSGKLISDGVWLTSMISVVVLILICMACRNWIVIALILILPFKIANFISIIISLILGVFTSQLFIRKVLLKEKELYKMYKQTKDEIIPLSKFTDIISINDEGVCTHTSGCRSIFVKITRGSTIQATDLELEDYKLNIKNFYENMLNNNIVVKYYTLEGSQFNSEVWDNLLEKSYDNEKLRKNMEIRKVYSKTLQKELSKTETEVYVLQTKYKESQEFLDYVLNGLTYLNSSIIKEYHIMTTEKELNSFGEQFFNSRHFSAINNTEIDDMDIFEIVEEDEYL